MSYPMNLLLFCTFLPLGRAVPFFRRFVNIFQRNSNIFFFCFLEVQISLPEDGGRVIGRNKTDRRNAVGGIDLFALDVGKKVGSIFDEFLVLELYFVLVAPNLVEAVHIKLDRGLFTCLTNEDMLECLKYLGSTTSSKARRL